MYSFNKNGCFNFLKHLKVLFICFLLLSCFDNLMAGQSNQTISAVKTEKPPHIDGKFDDEVWQSIPSAGGDFLQIMPDPGKPSKLTTTFKIAYDDYNLYVAVEMNDSDPSKIQHVLTRRDRDNESETVVVFVDSHHDHTTGRLFSVSAAGVQSDKIIINDSEDDRSWDAVWESEVFISKTGWNAEFRIPLTTLRFSPSQNLTWGLNVGRYIPRFQEVSTWAPLSEADQRMSSRAGHLTNINIQKKPLRYSILPYIAMGGLLNTDDTLTQSQGLANIQGVVKDNSYSAFGNVGIDAEYGITANTTLNATINPDFGQVEVDQEVINLTTFETFFEEKRPFFVEGSDVFATIEGMSGNPITAMKPFYSRRIGSTPINYDTPYTLDGTVKNNPQVVPILGATKLSGHTEKGFSFGVLNAVTGKTFADVDLSDGSELKVMTSPLTHYGVLRLSQNIGNNSYVGGMFTGTTRMDGERDAYMAMVDNQIRDDSGKYEVSSYLGLTSAQPSLGAEYEYGGLGQIKVKKISGGKITGDIGYSFTSPNVYLNDLGYKSYTGIQNGWWLFQYKYLGDNGRIRRFNITNSGLIAKLMSPSEYVNRGSYVNFYLMAKNYMGFWSGFRGKPFRDSNPYESRIDGLSYKTPALVSTWAGFHTPSNKIIQLELGGDFVKHIKESQMFSTYLSMNLTLGEHIELALTGNYSEAFGENAWANIVPDPINADNNISVFGKRDYRNLDFSLKGTITFTPNSSLQVYSQLLTGNATYSNYKALNEDGFLENLEFSFDPTNEPYSEYNPNFRMTFFQSNLIYRWEYKPGSTFYAVWTTARDWSDGNPQSAENKMAFADVFKKGSQNALMLKFNYRWGR